MPAPARGVPVFCGPAKGTGPVRSPYLIAGVKSLEYSHKLYVYQINQFDLSEALS
ncbi:MAG: hypothetical protein AVDCRST_MAG56-1280 [uncultured Cytophagales bacterium]|uniref:Uncharacterized protein n=1 Tax=uncultured Cytophagales bacterium TaxID=158755 RepID=A0A6J4HZY5_9SPHI|nr:MAG: hypothetical protein AVDCRST_MAG56-1280 [uncultured Cytophagales bacterium]